MKELEKLFLTRLEEAGAQIFNLTSPGEVQPVFSHFLTENSISLVASWDTGFLHALLDPTPGLEVLYPPMDSEDQTNLEEALLKVDAAVTEAILGVAESGALVLPMSKRMPRSFFILAPLHLVFIKRVNLLPTMEALFEELSQLEFEECVLESGPSRTADIEQTLTLGAHGPRRVVVFLI